MFSGVPEKILQQVHSISIKQDKLSKKVRKAIQTRSTISTDSVALNQEQFKLIGSHFPIDSNPENVTKKVEVVEEELSKNKFLKCVVSYL